MNVINVIFNEIKKAHKVTFHSPMMYFSLLIWPIASLYTTLYSYSSFDYSKTFSDRVSLKLFLLVGAMGYLCFWSFIQSAWQMSDERRTGTLETIFLSPVNRIAMIYGRALGSFIESCWMFMLYMCFMFYVYNDGMKFEVKKIVIAFIVLIVSSMLWGGFINVLFLFSRDAVALFSVLDGPMELFSGARMPVGTMPSWGKVIATIFPLTHSLVFLRACLLGEKMDIKTITALLITWFIMFALTSVFLKIGEGVNQEKGTYNIY